MHQIIIIDLYRFDSMQKDITSASVALFERKIYLSLFDSPILYRQSSVSLLKKIIIFVLERLGGSGITI